MADKSFARAKSLSELIPDVPHHIPGYAGYVPQRDFQYGQTFGDTTRKLFATGEARGASPTRGLSPSQTPTLPPIDTRSPNRSPSPSPGRTKKSGYTGYIPRGEEYFAQPYPDTAGRALAEFDDQLQHTRRRDDTFKETTARSQALAPHTQAVVDPLLSMSQRGRDQVSLPLTVDQQKSGYTGYIPQGFNQFGVSYPLASQRAGFEQQQLDAVNKAVLSKSVQL
eukprot:m.229655 g.229655  ORF g.229655 m.229655 type:complete len:224 (-) comp11934_c0_seq1:86-757(-)